MLDLDELAGEQSRIERGTGTDFLENFVKMPDKVNCRH